MRLIFVASAAANNSPSISFSVPHPTCDILHKLCGSGESALSTLERWHQLRFGINRAIRPHITVGSVIAYTEVSLFLPDESPDFVKLQIAASQILHLGIHQ